MSMLAYSGRILAILSAFLVASTTFAQEEPVRRVEQVERAKGPPRLEYKGRRIAPIMHYSHAAWLLREERQRQEDCETMLKNLGVEPGMTVCDMGCGNGFYSLPLARMVGDNGKVLAVDIQREMLLLLRRRAEEAGVTNIQRIHSTVVDPKLPKGKVDIILCVDVYHEFSYPEKMLSAMANALAPNGRVVLVEFRAEDPEVLIRPEHKMSKKQILKELVPNGFRLVREFDRLPWQHMMFFKVADPKKSNGR